MRIHPYLEPNVARRLAEYSAASGIRASMVVQSALLAHLDRTGDTALLLRRFDRRGLAIDNLQRDVDFFGEAFGVFVRLWLAYTPRLADDAKEQARRSSEARFAQFLEHVLERLTDGPRFFDDLRHEVLADEADRSRDAAASRDPVDDDE